MVARTIGRLLWVPIAFIVAISVTGFVLVTLGLEHITHAMHGQSEDGVDVAAEFLKLLYRGSIIASGLSILPALAVVIIGEVARIRSWLYYMIGAGLAAAAMPLLAGIDQIEAVRDTPALVWQVFATAGFAGGLIYWLLAGRRA
jgi:hypothetical protein